MIEKKRSDKLKRLVAVQRHLEKMAEYDLAETARQRREQGNPAAKLLQKLIGLEAKMKQYEQGERFIEVVERDTVLDGAAAQRYGLVDRLISSRKALPAPLRG